MHEKRTNGLAVLFTVAYMVSYITRINFGAIISEVEADTQISRTMLSAAVTGSFITYGIGQIFSGICADRFSPKKLVERGLVISVLMNLLMPLCNDADFMLAVWCINGFAQAFMWPPIVKLMVAAFSEEAYKKMAVKISWASSYGTILVYLTAPALITIASWKAVFYFSALCGIIMVVIWNKYCIDIPCRPRENTKMKRKTEKTGAKVLFSPVLIAVMLAIILQGMLRDGVTTWMPSYIADTYHLSTVVSILTGIVLPLFSILCTQISSVLYRRRLKSPVLCSAVMFLIGTISTISLYCVSGNSVIISVICSALLTGTMHGVSSMLTAMVPPYFKRYGNVSTATGALNACAYVGSGISTYGIAVLSEKTGWQNTLLVWCLIAALGSAVCLGAIKPWKKLFSN